MKANTTVLENYQTGLHKGRKRRRKLAVGCACAVAACAAFASGLIAFHTDSEGMGNLFTIGNVTIEAHEPGFPTKDTPEGGRVDGVPDDCELMIPYEEIPKDPYIRNIGKNDAIVYFRVTVPVERLNLIHDDGTTDKGVDADLFWMKLDSDAESVHANHFREGWVELSELDGEFVDKEGVNDEGRGKTYIFGWHVPLKSGQSTDKLFDKVQNKKYGSNTIRADEPEIIRVESFAIQSEFVMREGIDIDPSGELSEEDLTYIYQAFVNQNEETVGKGGWED